MTSFEMWSFFGNMIWHVQGVWHRKVDWTFLVSHRHVRFHHCPQMVTLSTADCFLRHFPPLSRSSIPPKSVLFELLKPSTSLRYWFPPFLGLFPMSSFACFRSPGFSEFFLFYFWLWISRSKLQLLTIGPRKKTSPCQTRAGTAYIEKWGWF